MAIYVAKSRQTLTHYFFRVVDSDFVHNTLERQMVPFINSLTSAKSHKQIASVVEKSPLLFSTNGGPLQPNRVMTPSECIDSLETDFTSIDPRLVISELFLYSPTPLRANRSKESPIAALDAFDCGLARQLSEAGNDVRVIVEPIQDWLTFRNLLSVCAALLANIQNPPDDEQILEASGFTHSEERENACRIPLYITPFKFQASTFALRFGSHPFVSSRTEGIDMDYLYGVYLENAESPIRRHRGVVHVDTRGFGGDDDVFTSTHYDVTQRGITPIDLLLLTHEEDRNVYLCVKDEGSQLDIAKRVVLALWNETQTLKDFDGANIGMAFDEQSLFDPENGNATYQFHSLMSRAWYSLCYQSGYRLIRCKHCGCGTFASNRGKGNAKEYCSDSCRVLDRG